jgi:ubiquitin-protein ligase
MLRLIYNPNQTSTIVVLSSRSNLAEPRPNSPFNKDKADR